MRRPWHVERALISGDFDYVTSFATERQAELRARDLRMLWPDERYRVVEVMTFQDASARAKESGS